MEVVANVLKMEGESDAAIDNEIAHEEEYVAEDMQEGAEDEFDLYKSRKPSDMHPYPYRLRSIESVLHIDDNRDLLSYRLPSRDAWIEHQMNGNTLNLPPQHQGKYRTIDIDAWMEFKSDERTHKDLDLAKRRTPPKVPNKLTLQEQVSKNLLDVNFKTISDLNYQEQVDVLATMRLAKASQKLKLTKLDKINLEKATHCNYSFKMPRTDIARSLIGRKDGVREKNKDVYDTTEESNATDVRKAAKVYQATKNYFNPKFPQK